MKTITKFKMAVLALSLTFTVASCSDDDNGSNGNGGNPSGEFVKAKVDGDNFSSSGSFDAVAASRPNASTLMIQGSDNSGKAINIMLLNVNGTGTYNVSDMMNGQATFITVNPVASYSSAAGNGASGEVEITHMDDEKIEGNFHFVGRLVEEGSDVTIDVTDGEFRANFQ